MSWNGRISVVLLIPKGSAIAPTTASVVATTGVVARQVNGAGDAPQTVSSDLTLTSLGVVRGWSVRQPNAGGQWDMYYEEPRLDVKSSGRTIDESAEEMTHALSAIEFALTDVQDKQNVKPDQRIRVELSPSQPQYTTQSGSRVRAMAGIALAGVMGTLGVLLSLEHISRRSTHPRVSASSGPG